MVIVSFICYNFNGDDMQQQPIDFKSMFQNDFTNLENNNNISGYIFSIGWYFITMFILATVVFTLFYSVDSLVETITPEDRITNALNTQEDYIYLLNNTGNFSDDNYFMISFEDNPSYTVFVLRNTGLDVLDDYGQVIYDNLFEILDTNTTLIAYKIDDLTLLKLDDNFDVFDVPLEPIEQLTNYANSLLNVVIYIILFIPIVWFLRSDLLFDYRLSLKLNKKIIGFVIAGYLYVIFGNIISNVFINLIAFIFSSNYTPASNQVFIESMLNDNGVFLMIIGAVILGPIVEELIFRKAMFGLIRKPQIALIVSSLIFALIHVVTELFSASFISIVLTTIPYLTMGFIFGFIYLKYNKNIYIVTLVHMLTNLISILGILYL